MTKPPMFNTTVDNATLDAAWTGIGAKRVRARRVRRAWMATPVVAALALVVLFVVRHFSPPVAATTTNAPHTIALAGGAPLPSAWVGTSESAVAFDDGSRIELSKDAHLVAATTTTPSSDPSRVNLSLDTGEVTFDIKPGGPRAWVIDAGNGTIVRVLGTRFTVTRDGTDGRHVHVAVARGKVRVESATLSSGGRNLTAGQDVDVVVVGTLTNATTSPTTTPPAAASPSSSSSTPVMAVENLASSPTTTPTVARATPRARNDHVAAAAPVSAGAPTPSPTPTPATDRLIDADVERKAGHPREAVAILTSVVDARDPRAPLAAFTIGKIHAEELANPALAATWFERAIGLGLPGGLEEEAYARVVECHGRAGHADDAARAEQRYEAKFPEGRHLARVKRWKRD